MKKCILIISSILLFATYGRSQSAITTTQASLPQLEDTLYTVIDTFPYIFILDASPNAQTWDFTALNTDVLNTTIVEAASTGQSAADFPDADVILPFYDGEGYAKIYADSIEIIGYNGSPIIQVQSFVANTPLTPSHTYRVAGLTYGDTYRDSVYFQVVEDGSNLDPSETFGVTVDSARMTINSVREDTVDAWGTMTTPFGTFDVIRVKQVEYRNTKVEAKFSIFDWTDISDFGTFEQLGDQVITTYLWLSADDKEPIARVERNEDTGFNRFCEWRIDKALTTIVNNDEVIATKPEVKVYPNPAAEEVNFELNSLRPGRYSLNFYNVIGRHITSEFVDVNGSHFHTVSLNNFTKGIYLYSLINEQGQLVLTEKLMVKKP